jgi:hypothetical protein
MNVFKKSLKTSFYLQLKNTKKLIVQEKLVSVILSLFFVLSTTICLMLAKKSAYADAIDSPLFRSIIVLHSIA